MSDTKLPPVKPPAPKGPPKTTRVRAEQRLFYNERLVEAGTVFDYTGHTLPALEIVVPVPADTPLGSPPEVPVASSMRPPSWTTPGYVDKFNSMRDRST